MEKFRLKDGRYLNFDPVPSSPKGLLSVLRWKLITKPNRWPKKVQNTSKPQLPASIASNEIYSTFINHATMLLQLERLNILTDPMFSNVAGPYSFFGPRRVRAPGLALQDLPKIDVVLISHNHYDHLDIPSIQALWKKDHPLFIMPLGNGKLIKSLGIHKVVELDWWQKHHLTSQESISLTPAHHWSRRGLFDMCKALWGGFMIQSSDLKIFFAGDSAYSNHFQKIKEQYGPIDLSLLPIGAYEPRWFMKDFHMNPAEAVQAHLDLESSLSLGIHFGTFRLTDEAIDDPVIHLKKSLVANNLSEKVFIAPEHGETIHYSRGNI
jgi:L-ascorbate metabolism protein UlaG (beta-lactamase superfamily)